MRCFQKYCHSFNLERSADGVGKSCCQKCSFSDSLQNRRYFFAFFRRVEANTRRARSASYARRERPSRRASLALRARLVHASARLKKHKAITPVLQATFLLNYEDCHASPRQMKLVERKQRRAHVSVNASRAIKYCRASKGEQTTRGYPPQNYVFEYTWNLV